jgi:hypothetical protein
MQKFMKLKIFGLVLVLASTPFVEAVASINCKASLIRVYKEREFPEDPPGRVVIARPDGTVIRSYENSNVRTEEVNFQIPYQDGTHTVKFKDGYELFLKVGIIPEKSRWFSMADVLVLTAALTKDNGQTTLAMDNGSSEHLFQPSDMSRGSGNLSAQVSILSSEISAAALKNKRPDLFTDYEMPVALGWVPDGTVWRAGAYCTVR